MIRNRTVVSGFWVPLLNQGGSSEACVVFMRSFIFDLHFKKMIIFWSVVCYSPRPNPPEALNLWSDLVLYFLERCVFKQECIPILLPTLRHVRLPFGFEIVERLESVWYFLKIVHLLLRYDKLGQNANLVPISILNQTLDIGFIVTLWIWDLSLL